MQVAVVGNDKLGLCLTLLLAEAGHDVVGVDTNPDHLAKLRRGDVPWHEADLPAMLDDFGPLVDWRSDPADAAEADVSFVVVPTPSLPSGAFDVSMVESAARSIGEGCRNGVSHVLCVVSTTNPGDCGGRIAEALTAGAGRELGRSSDGTSGRRDGLGLVYSPEFIALGDVFAGMRRPDLLLIGESHSWAGDRVSYLLRTVRSYGPRDLIPGQTAPPHVASEHRLTLTEAEIAKLSVNTMVTQKISAANALGELCEVYGARPHLVAKAVGADRRIGSAYFRPGRAYGGPCFPRDNRAIQAAGWRHGVEMPLAAATEQVNAHQVYRWAFAVDQIATPDAVVAVLGLSYKPGTAVIEESFGLALADWLAEQYEVVVFDPLAEVGESDLIHVAATLDEAVEKATVVVLANDDRAFRRGYPGSVVIDTMGALG